jgi:hypothetical protein
MLLHSGPCNNRSNELKRQCKSSSTSSIHHVSWCPLLVSIKRGLKGGCGVKGTIQLLNPTAVGQIGQVHVRQANDSDDSCLVYEMEGIRVM